MSFVTKDSGERAEFASGMVRDTDKGKARFDLLVAEGVPYKHQFLTRCAELMMRGAEKYNDRNWEKANSAEEVARMKSSAFRHFMQWFCGETDEDHAAAVIFNILAAETTEWKIKNGVERPDPDNPSPSVTADDKFIADDGSLHDTVEEWFEQQERLGVWNSE